MTTTPQQRFNAMCEAMIGEPPKKRRTPAETLAALADLFDEVEIESDEEAREILIAAGYDLEALDREIREIIAQAKAQVGQEVEL